MCIYIDGRPKHQRSLHEEFSPFLNVDSTSRWRVWIRGIRTGHVSQRCRLITSNYVQSGHVTRSRIQSGHSSLLLGCETHFAAKQIKSKLRSPASAQRTGPRHWETGRSATAQVWTFMKTRSQRSSRLKSTSFLCLYSALRSDKSAPPLWCTQWKAQASSNGAFKKCFIAAWRLLEERTLFWKRNIVCMQLICFPTVSANQISDFYSACCHPWLHPVTVRHPHLPCGSSHDVI